MLITLPVWPPEARPGYLVGMIPLLSKRCSPGRRPSGRNPSEPDLAHPISQLCTQSQIYTPTYDYWCAAIGETPRPHRKQWEYCYILQALATRGMLAPGVLGVGFGVGEEPLVAAIAARGASVVATDMASDAARAAGWIETDQHAADLVDLNQRGLCPSKLFHQSVRFRVADMNRIDFAPRSFDFVWSACALEHLGSIRAGERFVLESLKLLRPGGMAVHTTEYNLLDGPTTIDHEATVLFRRRDIARLLRRARRRGFGVKVNWRRGEGELDRHVDVPPYSSHRHLKLKIGAFPATSIGLIFEAPGRRG